MFIPAQIIKKTREKIPLTEEELRFFVYGYIDGTVADYQMSSWLMAVVLNGITQKETALLTDIMVKSGKKLDLSNIPGPKIDKHSTGGIGDKTSLIIAPIAMCAGVVVPMMSGRGLGHTGGTLDKLESMPGFTTQLTLDQFAQQLQQIGCALIGQTKEICPADRKMYALRDVTGTVESISLICASIVCKKVAEGIEGLVLDVKFGSGAFMKTLKDATALAKNLVSIAEQNGLSVHALLTNMNQPLGFKVGNSLEVEECLEVMKGGGPVDVRKLSLELAAHMILLGKKAKSLAAAKTLAEEILDSGQALAAFERIVSKQGGKTELPVASNRAQVLALKSGFVQTIETESIGLASLMLGAGRMQSADSIDPSAGLVIHKKIGDSIKKGEPLVTMHFNRIGLERVEAAQSYIEKGYGVGAKKVRVPKLIVKVIKGKGL